MFIGTSDEFGNPFLPVQDEPPRIKRMGRGCIFSIDHAHRPCRDPVISSEDILESQGGERRAFSGVPECTRDA